VSENNMSGRLLPWKEFDAEGVFVRLVFAANALDAAADLPAGHSVYVGGPSPREPARSWWADAWVASEVDPDELIANDPRSCSP
jgi:hypothetical protein